VIDHWATASRARRMIGKECGNVNRQFQLWAAKHRTSLEDLTHDLRERFISEYPADLYADAVSQCNSKERIFSKETPQADDLWFLVCFSGLRRTSPQHQPFTLSPSVARDLGELEDIMECSLEIGALAKRQLEVEYKMHMVRLAATSGFVSINSVDRLAVIWPVPRTRADIRELYLRKRDPMDKIMEEGRARARMNE